MLVLQQTGIELQNSEGHYICSLNWQVQPIKSSSHNVTERGLWSVQ